MRQQQAQDLNFEYILRPPAPAMCCLPHMTITCLRKCSSWIDCPCLSWAHLYNRCRELARLKTFLGPEAPSPDDWHQKQPNLQVPGAYPDSCRSKLSMEQADAWGAGLASQSLSLLRALSKQWTISASPLPEPVRAINIGICLCVLSRSQVPGPVLPKGPSQPPKGLSTSGNEVSQQLFLPRNIENRSK